MAVEFTSEEMMKLLLVVVIGITFVIFITFGSGHIVSYLQETCRKYPDLPWCEKKAAWTSQATESSTFALGCAINTVITGERQKCADDFLSPNDTVVKNIASANSGGNKATGAATAVQPSGQEAQQPSQDLTVDKDYLVDFETVYGEASCALFCDASTCPNICQQDVCKDIPQCEVTDAKYYDGGFWSHGYCKCQVKMPKGPSIDCNVLETLGSGKDDAVAMIGTKLLECWDYLVTGSREECSMLSTENLGDGVSITEDDVNNWLTANGGERGAAIRGAGPALDRLYWNVGTVRKGTPKILRLRTEGGPLVVNKLMVETGTKGETSCMVYNFQLPQKVSAASEWIPYYGDPKYLVYWNQFPISQDTWTFKPGWEVYILYVAVSAIPVGKVGTAAVGTGLKEALSVGRAYSASVAAKGFVRGSWVLNIREAVRNTGEKAVIRVLEVDARNAMKTAMKKSAVSWFSKSTLYKAGGLVGIKALSVADLANSWLGKLEPQGNVIALKYAGYVDPKLFKLDSSWDGKPVFVQYSSGFVSYDTPSLYFASPCYISSMEVSRIGSQEALCGQFARNTKEKKVSCTAPKLKGDRPSCDKPDEYIRVGSYDTSVPPAEAPVLDFINEIRNDMPPYMRFGMKLKPGGEDSIKAIQNQISELLNKKESLSEDEFEKQRSQIKSPDEFVSDYINPLILEKDVTLLFNIDNTKHFQDDVILVDTGSGFKVFPVKADSREKNMGRNSAYSDDTHGYLIYGGVEIGVHFRKDNPVGCPVTAAAAGKINALSDNLGGILEGGFEGAGLENTLDGLGCYGYVSQQGSCEDEVAIGKGVEDALFVNAETPSQHPEIEYYTGSVPPKVWFRYVDGTGWQWKCIPSILVVFGDCPSQFESYHSVNDASWLLSDYDDGNFKNPSSAGAIAQNLRGKDYHNGLVVLRDRLVSDNSKTNIDRQIILHHDYSNDQICKLLENSRGQQTAAITHNGFRYGKYWSLSENKYYQSGSYDLWIELYDQNQDTDVDMIVVNQGNNDPRYQILSWTDTDYDDEGTLETYSMTGCGAPEAILVKNIDKISSSTLQSKGYDNNYCFNEPSKTAKAFNVAGKVLVYGGTAVLAIATDGAALVLIAGTGAAGASLEVASEVVTSWPGRL